MPSKNANVENKGLTTTFYSFHPFNCRRSALGIEKYNHVILCAREDHNTDSPNYQKDGPKVHFDISGYDILFWNPENIDDFKLKLAQKIKYRLTIIEDK